MFTDELSEVRQRLYWEFFRDVVTLEEWQYACNQAMWRETFHKVPLPAVMIEYVRELRKGQREEQKRQDQYAQRHTLQLREALISEEERKAFFAQVLKDDRLKDPIPLYEEPR